MDRPPHTPLRTVPESLASVPRPVVDRAADAITVPREDAADIRALVQQGVGTAALVARIEQCPTMMMWVLQAHGQGLVPTGRAVEGIGLQGVLEVLSQRESRMPAHRDPVRVVYGYAQAGVVCHSRAVRRTCVQLARLLGQDLQVAAGVGLLHDIGQPVFAHLGLNLRGEMGTRMLAREIATCGHTHAALGALALARMGFASVVCHAIAHHHDPDMPPGPLAQVIWLGENVAAAQAGDLDAELLVLDGAARIGLDEEDLRSILRGGPILTCLPAWVTGQHDRAVLEGLAEGLRLTDIAALLGGEHTARSVEGIMTRMHRRAGLPGGRTKAMQLVTLATEHGVL